jgi:hypothetical protein
VLGNGGGLGICTYFSGFKLLAFSTSCSPASSISTLGLKLIYPRNLIDKSALAFFVLIRHQAGTIVSTVS